MIYTASFFNEDLIHNLKRYSIATSVPKQKKLPNGEQTNYTLVIHGKFMGFCPSWDLVSLYKYGKMSWKIYTEIYLNNLYKQFNIKTSQLNKDILHLKNISENNDVALLCWENKWEKCHRSLLANWLIENVRMTITIK